MRDKDIKILWGRSGNRCAICKLELTADGSLETLGEMAHVVGQSQNGPRGNHDLYTTTLILAHNAPNLLYRTCERAMEF